MREECTRRARGYSRTVITEWRGDSHKRRLNETRKLLAFHAGALTDTEREECRDDDEEEEVEEEDEEREREVSHT